ncbi:MAG TPA: response regulator transcription factor [Chthonomonadales bacterium]|nr:response regulator transcription factor [Chthonomonadales bacterium]
MAQVTILIVEDDPSLARFLEQAIREAGYRVVSRASGKSALAAAHEEKPDLILLDVMLPEMSGFEVCRTLRQSGFAAPILLITARDSLEDKIEGLDGGADDYLVKPFLVGELLARVRALLRRNAESSHLTPAVLQVKSLRLDTGTRRANRDGRTIWLSSTEYALLDYLMRNAGRVLTRSMILEHVWQYDFEGNDNVLDVYISYLRSKIDRGYASSLIRTVRGVGYTMEVERDA